MYKPEFTVQVIDALVNEWLCLIAQGLQINPLGIELKAFTPSPEAMEVRCVGWVGFMGPQATQSLELFWVFETVDPEHTQPIGIELDRANGELTKVKVTIPNNDYSATYTFVDIERMRQDPIKELARAREGLQRARAGIPYDPTQENGWS